MNPYEVLGVNPNDDEETIKKAYRSLVKKYHPDRYVNTPMADMATEKLKEINEAYDMITNKKTASNTGGNAGGAYGYGGYGGYGQGYGQQYGQDFGISFDSVRMLIRMRRLSEAERMLMQLEKNAEWYYLMGLIYINRGWYDKGKGFVETAVKMNPANAEYRATLNSFDAQNRSYREFRSEYINCCGADNLLTCLCGSIFCSRCCCC